MIRPAIFQDIPGVEALIKDQHQRSKYLGRVQISDKVMRDLLMAACAGQNQNGPQATYFRVVEEDGLIVAFMLGTLARIYHIGNKLSAQDLFLCAFERTKAAYALKLIDGYVAWARANPKVAEIMLSWSDALPGAERIAEVYRRKGFELAGEMYELRQAAGGPE